MRMTKFFVVTVSLILLVLSCSSGSDGGSDNTGVDSGSHDIKVYLTVRYSGTELSEQNGIDFSSDASDFTIRLDTADLKQEIDGFGGALTGASAYLIKNMSSDQQEAILKDLFTDEGINMKYLRICIGSSDFSMGNYTYCDSEGIDNFAVPDIDRRDLLPVLKSILNLNPDIKILASPWSPPAWMKDNGNLYGGSLAGEPVYESFAEYFLKYVEAMETEGIPIDALTIQNEPMYENDYYPTMYMPSEEQNKIIRDYLGPLFESEGIKTKLLILDHNFDEVDYPISILSDSKTYNYVSGVAFHGYSGSPEDIDGMITQFPDVPVYFTEQSGGGWNTDEPIGNMLYYMKEMVIPCMNRGSKNFLMWNIALDEEHGPVTSTTGGCQDCRGIVTVKEDGSYSVNEEYYLLGHFSKFLKEGAHRIGYSTVGAQPDSFLFCTFMNPDGSKVAVFLNQSGAQQKFTVRTGDRRFTYTQGDQSVVTFVYD